MVGGSGRTISRAPGVLVVVAGCNTDRTRLGSTGRSCGAQRVTLNNRWLYQGSMATYASEWTGVIVPGVLDGDTYMPCLRLGR